MLQPLFNPAIVALLSAVAAAETITVCPDGSCDYTDIQPAVDAAERGDVILVSPGIYAIQQGSGSVVDIAFKGIELRSTDGPLMTTIHGGGVHLGLMIRDTREQEVKIVGFTFTACSNSAVQIHDSHVDIEDCFFLANESPEEEGVVFGHACSVNVTNSVFRKNTGIDIHAIGNTNAVLQGNQFDPMGEHPSVRIASSNADILDTMFTGVVDEEGHGTATAISCDGGVRLLVQDCRFESLEHGIQHLGLAFESAHDIVGCAFLGNSDYSIDVHLTAGESVPVAVALEDCTFSECEEFGMRFTGLQVDLELSFTNVQHGGSPGGLAFILAKSMVAELSGVSSIGNSPDGNYILGINALYEGGSLVLDSCEFSENQSQNRGALHIVGFHSVVVRDTIFRDNIVGIQSCINLHSNVGDVQITDCDFIGNVSSRDAACVGELDEHSVIERSVFIDNVGHEGNVTSGGQFLLVDSTITGCCPFGNPPGGGLPYADGGGNVVGELLCRDCPSDVNCDRVTDAADLGRILTWWDTDSAVYDIDGDGIVGGTDLGILLVGWGACP